VNPNPKPHPFDPEAMDLSKLTIEQLQELKDAILARAGRQVGPQGFDPVMQESDGGSNWWDWIEQIVDELSWAVFIAARFISLAIISVGAAITGAQLYASERGSAYAGAALIVGAVFGVWFVVEMFRKSARTAR
jgi:hypothetical protein